MVLLSNNPTAGRPSAGSNHRAPPHVGQFAEIGSLACCLHPLKLVCISQSTIMKLATTSRVCSATVKSCPLNIIWLPLSKKLAYLRHFSAVFNCPWLHLAVNTVILVFLVSSFSLSSSILSTIPEKPRWIWIEFTVNLTYWWLVSISKSLILIQYLVKHS